ncbi:MAG: ribonuclease III [Alphaproteobacteria bacterium]|nr:ribonuclease III [Alphaproteobacteria bacterium]TAD91997.1 MAG: ribonuclease III [Alphaproteobacteria bacterium]
MAQRNTVRPSAAVGSVTPEALADRLHHRFADPALLVQALRHASTARGRDRGNERLEFLGDRVLGLCVAEMLYRRFPTEREGLIARRHAALVNRATLADIAREVSIDQAIIFAKGEPRHTDRPAVLADAVEAVIAALYLDGGLDIARAFVHRHWQERMEATPTAPRDAKTSLQEWALARGLALPVYKVTATEGPPHQRRFTVAVEVADRVASGDGVSKQSAEKAAASALLACLEAGA